MKSFKSILNTYELLIKSLNVVQIKERNKFTLLIILLVIQSFLDVITIASIIPLLYILEGKDNLRENISNLLMSGPQTVFHTIILNLSPRALSAKPSFPENLAKYWTTHDRLSTTILERLG